LPLRTSLERLDVTSANSDKLVLLDSDGETAQVLHEEPSGRKGGVRGEAVPSKAPVGCSMLSKLYELDTNQMATLFKRFLGSIAYYAFSPPLMRYGWNMPEIVPSPTGPLLPNGPNLPFVLFRLKNEDEPRYRRLMAFVSQVEPEIDSIGFWVAPDNRPIPYVILKGGTRVSWDSLSDGTLCILALAAVFIFADRTEDPLSGWVPSVTMIEEPENSLYCGLLQSLWEDFSGLAPQSQFIFTSHSPYFIDLFDRDLSSVTSLRKDQMVTAGKPLTQYRSSIQQYRGDFSLGELHYKELFA